MRSYTVEAGISGDGIATDNSHLNIRNAPETVIGLGATYVTELSFGEFDSMGVHKASVELQFNDSFRLRVYGRNLSDERYVRVFIIPNFTHFGQYNAPRHVRVDFTYEF